MSDLADRRRLARADTVNLEGAGRAFVEAVWIDQALKALVSARREANLSNPRGSSPRALSLNG